MFDRPRRGANPLAKFIFGFWLIFAASTFLMGGTRDPLDQPLYEIVAVGRGPGQILLATLASPSEKLQWRYRKVPVSPSNKSVGDVVPSVGGTKALVVFADGTPHVFDLTKRITGIIAGDVPSPQHRLPQQIFPYVKDGEVCLLNDLGQPTQNACERGLAAAVNEDGRVLYARGDGRLVVVSPQTGAREELAYRLPRGADFRLLAGLRGDSRDFLVLVTECVAKQAAGTSAQITKIIDPRNPDLPMGQSANFIVAALRAQLEFSSANSPGEKGHGSNSGAVIESTVETLASNLVKEAYSADVTWSFYRVTPNNSLYAPVLEFADNEPDYPSDVNFWEEIMPRTRGNSIEDFKAAYKSMGDKRWSRCTMYVRTLSYPGTWLIEYWFYYPFDEGKAHPHIHDSEHLFVEVDKLGGTVRNVFASDHDSFVPNNMYSTLVKNAPPVALPLFATAELGKHAMAPDMDHDGRFSRGVDDNMHNEAYAVWGLRDQSSTFNFMMEPYFKSMSLPHTRDGRFALADAEVLFPGLDVPADHLVCALQPFPDDPPCPKCGITTAEAATTYLVDHPDARVPEGIYKPFVLPWHEVRFGVGLFDWTDGRGELSLAYVGDVRHMTGGLLHIPARLGLEYGWRPYGREVAIPIGGQMQFVNSTSTMYTGVRVERLITNTQGLYFAATPKLVDITVRDVNGVLTPSPLHWAYGGVSYHFGYVLELPSAHKGNLVHHIGALVGSVPGFPLLLEWRVSIGFLRTRGRDEFGARLGDRDPYGPDSQGP
jgi:hypothetical protein